MIEILCCGEVHYTRPDDHPDVKEIKALIESGKAPGYSIREVDNLKDDTINVTSTNLTRSAERRG